MFPAQFIFFVFLLGRRQQLRYAHRCISLKEQKQKFSWPAIAVLDQGSISTPSQSITCIDSSSSLVFWFLLPVINMRKKDYKALLVEVQCFNPRADALHSLQVDLFANAHSGCLIWLLTYMTTSSDACFFQACLYKHQDHEQSLPPVQKWHQAILWHQINRMIFPAYFKIPVILIFWVQKTIWHLTNSFMQ